jgi:CRP-like cAMP-binding protein
MANSPEPQHGYWGTLSATGRAALIAAGSWSVFAAGSVLLAQRDDSGDVLVVWSGLAKAVARGAEGKQVVLALRGPGDVLGELGNLTGGQRSAAVIAVNQVEALTVRRIHFTRFLHDHPGAADSLQRTIIDRLYEADRDRLAAASMTVGQRIAGRHAPPP